MFSNLMKSFAYGIFTAGTIMTVYTYNKMQEQAGFLNTLNAITYGRLENHGNRINDLEKLKK